MTTTTTKAQDEARFERKYGKAVRCTICRDIIGTVRDVPAVKAEPCASCTERMADGRKVHVDRPNLNGQIRILVVADSSKAATFVLARAIAALAARGYSLVLEADDLQIDRGPCDADFRGQFMVDVTPKCSRVTVARALRAAELVVEA